MSRKAPTVREMKSMDAQLECRLAKLDRAMQEMEDRMSVFGRKKKSR